MYYSLPSASGVTSPPPSCASWEHRGVTCLRDTDGDAVASTELIQTDGSTLLKGRDIPARAALADDQGRRSGKARTTPVRFFVAG